MQKLSVLRIAYWGPKGAMQVGQLIVHIDVAADYLKIFQQFFQEHFPFGSVRAIDYFFHDDERYSSDPGIGSRVDLRSMEADNTSALCARYIVGTKIPSDHSSGVAVDFNPSKFNPWVKYTDETCTTPEIVVPAQAKQFADRSVYVKGMLTEETIKPILEV